jgi:hypothetical protein
VSDPRECSALGGNLNQSPGPIGSIGALCTRVWPYKVSVVCAHIRLLRHGAAVSFIRYLR